jgi:hypothetical protein
MVFFFFFCRHAKKKKKSLKNILKKAFDLEENWRQFHLAFFLKLSICGHAQQNTPFHIEYGKDIHPTKRLASYPYFVLSTTRMQEQ